MRASSPARTNLSTMFKYIAGRVTQAIDTIPSMYVVFMAKPTSLQSTWWRTTRQMRLGSFLVVNIKTVMNNMFCNVLCSNNYKLVKVRAKTKAMLTNLGLHVSALRGGFTAGLDIKFSSSKTVAVNRLRIFNAQWQYVLLLTNSKAQYSW